jgi:hypothetical protein
MRQKNVHYPGRSDERDPNEPGVPTLDYGRVKLLSPEPKTIICNPSPFQADPRLDCEAEAKEDRAFHLMSFRKSCLANSVCSIMSMSVDLFTSS